MTLRAARAAARAWEGAERCGEPFYQRIDASLGEHAKPDWDYNDPAHRWARAHRHRFEDLRYSAWRRLLPPHERFK